MLAETVMFLIELACLGVVMAAVFVACFGDDDCNW